MDMWLWSVVLLLVGLAIVGLEVFVPSGGVLGIVAALCLIGGIVVAFMHSLHTGFVMLGLTTLAVPILVGLIIQWWPHTPIGRRVLITPPENPDDVLPDTEEYRGLKVLVGRRGRSVSKMLPGGVIAIDRRHYDAVSVGMPIDEDQPVEVVEARMNRLVVRPCAEADRELPPPSQPLPARDELLSRPIDSLGLEDPLA